jgi:effector-binding domain-containing protein
MKKFQLISNYIRIAFGIILLQIPISIFADVPHFDIIEVMFENKKYYAAGFFNEGGVLKNHDLCYYDANGEYIGEVKDCVLNYGNSNMDYISLYSSMEKINIVKLNCYEKIGYNIDDVLKVLNGEKEVSMKEFKVKFKLLDAYHGNTPGFTYTNELKETDNIWIGQYPIEKLFCLDDNEFCHYGFFTIKGNLNKKEKLRLETQIKYLLSSYELNDKFWKKISELYHKQIIMVGFCSC